MAHRHFMTGGLAAGIALAAALSSAPARAAELMNWYVGASTDSTHIEVFRGSGWETGGAERGLSVRGGLQVSRHFAVELGALRTIDLEWSEYLPAFPGALNSHTTFDTAALQTAAVGRFGGRYFEGYFKAGIALYDVDGQQVLDDAWTGIATVRAVSDSGSGYLLGGGLGINATPKWRVRLEYQFFELDGDFLGVPSRDDVTIDTLAIGVDYRFGNERATVKDFASPSRRRHAGTARTLR